MTIPGCLSKSWNEDPESTPRLIRTLRNVPYGKDWKNHFIGAYILSWGTVLCSYILFLYLLKWKNRVFISNLHLFVEPVCPPAEKRKSAKDHGRWKDFLDILCLATLDELSTSPASFLHAPRMKFVLKPRKTWKTGTPDSRIEQSKVEGQEHKVAAKQVPYSLQPSSCQETFYTQILCTLHRNRTSLRPTVRWRYQEASEDRTSRSRWRSYSAHRRN